VFAEIGREFARFMATVPVDAGDDSLAFLAFAAGLRPGPPPDGQDYLREAFAHYQRQRLESDASAQAAWILLANLKIGLHEQTRLQPQIVAAVNAPIVTAEDLGARMLHALVPGSRTWPRIAHDPLAKVIGWMASRVRRDAVKATQEVVTHLPRDLRHEVRLVPARRHAVRREGLVRAPPADALHRPPVPRVCRLGVAVRTTVHASAGRKFPVGCRAGRRALMTCFVHDAPYPAAGGADVTVAVRTRSFGAGIGASAPDAIAPDVRVGDARR